MIQRIQTVYLALVFILSALLLTVAPVGTFTAQSGGISETYVYKASSVQKANAAEVIHLGSNTFLIVELIMILVTTAIIIFLYRNRLMQLKLGKFNLFAHFILIIILFFYTENEFKRMLPGAAVSLSYSVGAFIPLINIMLIILANRAVKKDELLVRSADRLR